MTDKTYNKLRGRIVEKFGSQAAFADAIGMTKQNLSFKLNGRVMFSAYDIEQWSAPDLLDIKPAEYGEYFFT